MLIFAIFAIQNVCYAQKYHFEQIGTDEGLPSNDIYFAHEDTKGYLWFGSDKGLVRYNGQEFKILTTENGLHSNAVFGITEDNDERLWLATFTSKIQYFWKGKVNNYNYITQPPELKQYLKFPLVYMNSEARRAFMDNGQQGNWMLESSGDTVFSLASSHLLNDPNNLLNGLHCELVVVDGENVPFRRVSAPKLIQEPSIQVKGKRLILDLPFVEDNWLQLSFYNLYDKKIIGIDGHGNYVLFNHDEVISYGNIGIKGLSNVYEDDANNFFFGCKDGVFIFNQENLKEKPRHILKGNYITQTLKDREGNYWFTSIGKGVFKLSSLEFKVLNSPAVIHFEKKKNKLWISTLEGEIGFMDTLNSYNFYYQDHRTGFDKYPFLVNENNLSLFLPGARILKKDFSVVKNQLTDKGHTAYKSIAKYQKQIYAAHTDGIYIFDSNGKLRETFNSTLMQTYFQANSKVEFNQRTYSLLVDKNKLWIGTESGLYYYQGDSFIKVIGPKINIQVRITSIIHLDEEHLLIGTNGLGLYILNKETFETKRISVSDGLSSNLINCIYKDGKQIYIGGNKGLNIVKLGKDFEVLETNIVNLRNGLNSNLINDITSFNNQIWLATEKGLIYFQSKNIRKNKVPPPIYFHKATTKEATIEENEGLYTFSPSTREVNIEFNAVSYRSGKDMQYKYILEGYEEDTFYLSTNQVQFSKLEPGEYKFHVWARNEHNIWSITPAEFSFQISPYYYETIWFKVFLMALIVILAYYVFRQIVRNKKKALVNKLQTVELRQKALTAMMSPHFIHNSLSAIQNLINKGNVKESNEYLSKFALLVRQNLNAVKKGHIILEEEIERLELYLSLEKLRFGDKLNFKINLKENFDIEGIEIPSMIVQPFVENAIWHGILPKGEGELVLNITQISSRKFQIEIIDDGVGLTQTLNKKNTHNSLSTSITQERLRLLTVETGKEHRMEVMSNDKNLGTKVIICLPIE